MTQKEEVMALITKLGGIRAHSYYSGEGDSGSVDDVEVYDASGYLVPISEGTSNADYRRLLDLVDEIVYEELDAWYDGDGGCGTIEIKVADNTITIDHSDYVIETVSRGEAVVL